MGLLGAKHLDVSRLRARSGLVLDSDAPGYLFTRAPAANHLEFVVHGLEAHAGMAPEEGISAIRVAAEGIAAMRLGEARSHDVAKLEAQCTHMRECLEAAAARHVVSRADGAFRASIASRVVRSYEEMAVPDESPIVQLVFRAAAAIGAMDLFTRGLL